MKRFVLFSVLLVFLSSINAQIAKWTFEGVTVSGTSSTAPSVTVGSTQADLGSLTSGSVFSALHTANSAWTTPAGNGSTKSLSGSNWSLGNYYQFLFKTTNYSSISISWDATGSNTGPRDFKVQYSTDGTTFTDATGTNSTYTLTNDGWTSASSVPASTRTLDLSGVTSLNNAATVYIRLVTTSTIAINGGAVASGGTSRVDNFTVNGTYTGPTTNFYSKSSGNLTDVTTWGDQTDGSGTQPTNFTSDGQIFNIVNRVSVTLDANWTVSGTSSKVITGDGLSGTTFIIPVGAALTGTIDVSNLSTLQLVNTTLPTFGTLSLGSTVEYAQTTTPYTVPTGNTYHHLKITGNTKTFASGTIAVNGNLTVDNVSGFNGSATPFTTLNLAGNFTLQNGAAFEPIATGDGNRMTLTCSGSGTQTLSGGDFYLFRLQSPAAGTVTIALSAANLTLGNATSGGLNLLQGTHTLSIGSNTLTIHKSGFVSATNLGKLSGTTSSNLIIDRTSGTSSIGTISFAIGGEFLNNFTYNCASGTSTTLTLGSVLSVNGNLTLTAGKIDIGANDLSVTGTASSSSTTSYVKTSSTGALKLVNVTGLRTAPIGNSTYNPVTVTNTSGHTWSTRVEDVLNVPDPTFATNTVKAVQREWYVNPSVIPPSTNADITFQYDDGDVTQIGASYNTSELVQVWRKVPSGFAWLYDWVAVNTTQAPTGSPGGIRTVTASNWGAFNNLSFAISNMTGPLPVKLIAFNAVKVASDRSNITWELAACCSSAARFELQRSFDGRSFETITTINGSETNRYYGYIDNGLGKFITYYRLKATDADGAVIYSKVAVIVNSSSSDILITSMAPNPVVSNAMFTISASKQQKAEFQLLNSAGVVVKRWSGILNEGNTSLPVSVQNLAAGHYTIMAFTESGKTTLHFIKQ